MPFYQTDASRITRLVINSFNILGQLVRVKSVATFCERCRVDWNDVE